MINAACHFLRAEFVQVRQTKKDLVVIDPYFDDTCLPLIAQKRPGVTVTVVHSANPRC